MAKRWSVECVECGAKESFADVQDISHAHWTVLAWIVPSGEPRVTCPKCEYSPSGPKPKAKK